jgi:hypothetical protein
MVGTKDILTGILLFWPAFISLFCIGFFCIVFAIFLIGSTVLISCIFMYGFYYVLRDLGTIDWFVQKFGIYSELVSVQLRKNIEESFLFNMPKPVNLKGPSLYLCHPHGLYGLTWVVHFSSCLSKWPLEKRPLLAIHSVFFKLPFFNEIMRKNRCIEATEKNIVSELKAGNSVALLVGGIEELHSTQPGKMNLVLKKRKGYARIAKETGVPLVPLVSLGENELFPASDLEVWKWFGDFLYRKFKLALPLPTLTSLWSWVSIGYRPFDKPLQTYILEPLVETHRMSIEEIRNTYIQKIEGFAKEYSIPLHLVS